MSESGTGNFEFEALRHARNYRRALLEAFSPHLRGGILEVGAGIGQFTEEVLSLPGTRRLLALEPDARFCEQFRRRLPGQALLCGTSFDLASDTMFDAIVSINVLEHIKEDDRELARYAKLLRAAKGHLCLFVPARPEIYAPIDRDFGHFRRYTRPELAAKLRQAGFAILRLHYFNLIGYFAWWLNFCVLRRRKFEPSSVSLFDRFIFPVVRILESKIAHPPVGQSLLAVARA